MYLPNGVHNRADCFSSDACPNPIELCFGVESPVSQFVWISKNSEEIHREIDWSSDSLAGKRARASIFFSGKINYLFNKATEKNQNNNEKMLNVATNRYYSNRIILGSQGDRDTCIHFCWIFDWGILYHIHYDFSVM